MAFRVFNSSSYKWYEIDDIQDLDMASLLFANDKEKYQLISKRYGGYWRFEVLDYCYLVNHFLQDTIKMN